MSRISPLLCSVLFFAILIQPAGGYDKELFYFPPPVPDSSSREAVLNFVAESYECELPGAVGIKDNSYDSLSADYSSSCTHTLKKYIDRSFSQTDSLYTTSSVSTAIYTFHRFCIPEKSTFLPFDTGRFSHQQFLALYDEEEPEIKKESWFAKMLNKAYVWFSDFIKYINDEYISPLRTLDFSWKVFITVAAVALLIGLSAVASRFAKRIYPQQNAQLGTSPYMVHRESIPTLGEAQSLLETGDIRGAVSVLYGWVAYTSDKFNIVKRYEWWTNRQFIILIKGRSSVLGGIASDIVREYENIVFGHRSPQEDSLQELIRRSHSAAKKVR